MKSPQLSRRRFAGALGAAAALAAASGGLRRAAAAGPEPAPALPIRIGSNESPYGPSDEALDAMRQALGESARHPYPSMREVTAAVAGAHGVDAERVVLGCGSSEILRVAAAAFLGPGEALVVAEPTFEAVLDLARVTCAETVRLSLTADFRTTCRAWRPLATRGRAPSSSATPTTRPGRSSPSDRKRSPYVLS